MLCEGGGSDGLNMVWRFGMGNIMGGGRVVGLCHRITMNINYFRIPIERRKELNILLRKL